MRAAALPIKTSIGVVIHTMLLVIANTDITDIRQHTTIHSRLWQGY